MWSAEKLTVKFYLAPGVRNRKCYLAPGMRNGKIYLAPNDSYEKFYLAFKGLMQLHALQNIESKYNQITSCAQQLCSCCAGKAKVHTCRGSVYIATLTANQLSH